MLVAIIICQACVCVCFFAENVVSRANCSCLSSTFCFVTLLARAAHDASSHQDTLEKSLRKVSSLIDCRRFLPSDTLYQQNTPNICDVVPNIF